MFNKTKLGKTSLPEKFIAQFGLSIKSWTTVVCNASKAEYYIPFKNGFLSFLGIIYFIL